MCVCVCVCVCLCFPLLLSVLVRNDWSAQNRCIWFYQIKRGKEEALKLLLTVLRFVWKSEDYPRKKTDFVLYVFRFCFIWREKQMILRFRIQCFFVFFFLFFFFSPAPMIYISVVGVARWLMWCFSNSDLNLNLTPRDLRWIVRWNYQSVLKVENGSSVEVLSTHRRIQPVMRCCKKKKKRGGGRDVMENKGCLVSGWTSQLWRCSSAVEAWSCSSSLLHQLLSMMKSHYWNRRSELPLNETLQL